MRWFQVYDPAQSTPEFAHEVEAHDADEAAEIVCPDLDGGNEGFKDVRTVLVRERGAETWDGFDVYAEAVVQYTAYECERSNSPAEQPRQESPE